ncbi:MAG: hypothetical protein ACI9DO_000277 [Reinekea sp.]|jgi:hypothetical protein
MSRNYRVNGIGKVFEVCLRGWFSDLMVEVFGEKVMRARTAFGTMSVRGILPIIIDSIFEVI